MTPKRDSRGVRETEESETERLSARLRRGMPNRTPPTPLRVVGGQVHQSRDALDLFLRSSFSMVAQMELEGSTIARTQLTRLLFFFYRFTRPNLRTTDKKIRAR